MTEILRTDCGVEKGTFINGMPAEPSAYLGEGGVDQCAAEWVRDNGYTDVEVNCNLCKLRVVCGQIRKDPDWINDPQESPSTTI